LTLFYPTAVHKKPIANERSKESDERQPWHLSDHRPFDRRQSDGTIQRCSHFLIAIRNQGKDGRQHGVCL